MPFVPYIQDPIVVEIADKVEGSTRLKRKARFLSMSYSQGSIPQYQNSNFVLVNDDQVQLHLLIELYSAGPQNADGSFAYGEPLEGKKGFSNYNHNIIANNSTMVDAATGEVLCSANEYEAAVILAAQGGVDVELVLPEVLKGRNFMREGQRFRMIAQNYQITVDPMIIDHIQRADIP